MDEFNPAVTTCNKPNLAWPTPLAPDDVLCSVSVGSAEAECAYVRAEEFWQLKVAMSGRGDLFCTLACEQEHAHSPPPNTHTKTFPAAHPVADICTWSPQHSKSEQVTATNHLAHACSEIGHAGIAWWFALVLVGCLVA